jgi:hypothetical protein
VSPEVIGGRLIRVCPECQEHVVERTDDDGMISNNFADHYEAAHPPEQEPERQRCYILELKPRDDGKPGIGAQAARDVSRQALRWVEKQIAEVDWALAPEVADLPEGAPTILAGQVLAAGFSNDPTEKQIRWYKRDRDALVFTPTLKQIDEWDEASERARHVGHVLVDRHEDEKPRFTSGNVDYWERFYEEEFRPWAADITNDFDEQKATASHEFWTGQACWLATLNAAIDAAGVSDEEIEASRAQYAESIAAVESR